jgi:Membrane-bound serine protease (ClpP class)
MKTGKYTVYTITTTIAEEAALVAVVRWLLPRFGINIPLWGLILLMTALGAYSYMTYRLGKKALNKKPMMPSPEVGCRGRVTTPLTPKGYIKVNGELWEASSTGSTIHEGEEVIIVGREGLTFIVSIPDDDDNADKATTLHS